MRELYQVVEVGPAWYQENIPCQEACPVKTNCRGYLNLAAAGEFEKGWELALDPNPMASICGSVCAAPCETACRRKEVDKPLSIRYVKKFLSDWTHQNVRTDGHAYTQPPAPVFGPPRRGWQARDHPRLGLHRDGLRLHLVASRCRAHVRHRPPEPRGDGRRRGGARRDRARGDRVRLPRLADRGARRCERPRARRGLPPQ